MSPASRRPSSGIEAGAGLDEPEVKETYAQALYAVLWKPIYISLGLAHGLLGCWLIKQMWSEPIGYAYAIAFLVSAPVAYVELELFARAMRWEAGPIFEWRERITIITAVGYVIALALTIVLAVNEANSREQSLRAAAQAEREQAQLRALQNSPDVKRGAEALEALRAARDRRNGKGK